MQELLKPFGTENLKDVFSLRFEILILSKQFPVDQKLPFTHDLSLQIVVSRPVVHEGLLDLALKVLDSLISKVGIIVSNYHKEDYLSLLTCLALTTAPQGPILSSSTGTYISA